MSDSDLSAEFQQWLVVQGYDARNLVLLRALCVAADRVSRPLSEEERHRIVEAALMGSMPPDVRH